MDPEKKSLNFIFPTKYVIPKSLKFSHWPSKFINSLVMLKPKTPRNSSTHFTHMVGIVCGHLVIFLNWCRLFCTRYIFHSTSLDDPASHRFSWIFTRLFTNFGGNKWYIVFSYCCWWFRNPAITTWHVWNPCKEWDKLPASTGFLAGFPPSTVRFLSSLWES